MRAICLARWAEAPVRRGEHACPAAPRQGPRTAGPIGPDPWAATIVKRNLHDLEAPCNGVMRALAKPGACAAQGTGSGDAPALGTTAQDEGWGPVTRKRRLTDTRDQVHESEGPVDGWQLIVGIDASAKMPWAGQVVPIQAQAGLSRRALVTQARTHLAGSARLHTSGRWPWGENRLADQRHGGPARAAR